MTTHTPDSERITGCSEPTPERCSLRREAVCEHCLSPLTDSVWEAYRASLKNALWHEHESHRRYRQAITVNASQEALTRLKLEHTDAYDRVESVAFDYFKTMEE